ncbi:MAG: hypothetical protein LBQ34_07270, partial [Alphaproteobacteria bacterium]|nr:hypothetical protein [Alphaproteobacteria bacterium]
MIFPVSKVVFQSPYSVKKNTQSLMEVIENEDFKGVVNYKNLNMNKILNDNFVFSAASNESSIINIKGNNIFSPIIKGKIASSGHESIISMKMYLAKSLKIFLATFFIMFCLILGFNLGINYDNLTVDYIIEILMIIGAALIFHLLLVYFFFYKEAKRNTL